MANRISRYHNLYNTDTLESIYVAALLHDVKEDLHYTNEQLKAIGYNNFVVELVDILTKGKSENYDNYIERISNDVNAKRIKICGFMLRKYIDAYWIENTSIIKPN